MISLPVGKGILNTHGINLHHYYLNYHQWWLSVIKAFGDKIAVALDHPGRNDDSKVHSMKWPLLDILEKKMIKPCTKTFSSRQSTGEKSSIVALK